MSVTVAHLLQAKGLKQMLLDAGVVGPVSLGGKTYDNVLDMSKCCAELWEQEKPKHIEYGVLDFSKRDPEMGFPGLRRDLTPEEIAELPYWPIEFRNNDEAMWLCCWREKASPAFYISKRFPEVEFQYSAGYEDCVICEGTIKNATFQSTQDEN